MDIVDKQTRSRMMARVRQKHTTPEMVVRRLLHSTGLRFRLHDRRLPGTPDLVLRRYRVAVFVHGCFWHYHQNCKYAKIPASNRDAWRSKLEKNSARDHRQITALHEAGWRVLVVWACALHDDPNALSNEMTQWIRNDKAVEKIHEIRAPYGVSTATVVQQVQYHIP